MMVSLNFSTLDSKRRLPRAAFTVVECLAAFAVLAVAAALVAQLATWSLGERARSDARQEAIEAAANLLEMARGQPWDDLTEKWAAERKLPDQLVERWSDSQLAFRIELEKGRPRVKRVTVEVKWTAPGRATWVPVKLTALFAARTAGGTP